MINKSIDDHWMRPNTKAGTEEMRKRIKEMRGFLKEAVKLDSGCAIAFTQKIFEFMFCNQKLLSLILILRFTT